MNKESSISLIKLDNFNKEVLEEKKPILLLCMTRNDEFQQQMGVIEDISKKYGEELKIGLIDEEFIGVFKQKFNIKGTPTFLIFVKGQEKSRMLGEGDQKTLKEFLLRTLKLFKR